MTKDEQEIIKSIETAEISLLESNPALKNRRHLQSMQRKEKLQKVLVANRGEIAKRFFLSLREENIPSVAVVTDVDIGQSWYDFADEAIFIGDARNYVSISTVLAAALISDANAIYPGYGFLSEDVNFVEALEAINKHAKKDISFMGPCSSVMKKVGNKLAARTLAKENNVPLFEGSESINDITHAEKIAENIGYPVIVKLDAGGGGKGMIPVFTADKLNEAIVSCQRIGEQLYKNTTFYLEKFIEYPVHIEVQIFNGMAVGVRKCAVQRRNQKIIEESGHSFVDEENYKKLLDAAENMAYISGYKETGGGAGTVEFLMDAKSGEFGFLEMNTRLQVEYGVTDQAMEIDLVKWQILFFDGRENEIPFEKTLERRLQPRNHSIECRIYAEEPEKNYAPSTGEIKDTVLPSFNGIRCDFGFKRGDKILMNYDPMIGKLISYGSTRKEAILRIKRALEEFYVSGISTNTFLLLKILDHEEFLSGNYTNRLLSDYPELEKAMPEAVKRGDRRSKTPIVLAALAEHVRIIHKAAEEYVVFGHIENFQRNHQQTKIPDVYDVQYQDEKYSVRFIQSELDTFYVFVDNIYNGKFQISFSKNKEDDYLIRLGLKSIRIRIDRRSNYIILKMKDHAKVQYYNLKIFAEDTGKKQDPQGLIRSPFQGTFVTLGKEKKGGAALKIGSKVKKDDVVIVVSAMKMEVPLTAPVDGTISQLLENGDMNKLELGKTPDGLIIGRNVREGEILFLIEGEDANKQTDKEVNTENRNKEIEASLSMSQNMMDFLYFEELSEFISKNKANYFSDLIKILKTFYLGYNQNHSTFDKLNETLKKIIENKDFTVSEEAEKEIISIIEIFHNVNKIFSPIVEEDYSYFEELNRLIVHWKDLDYSPPEYFRELLNDIIISYGVKDGAKVHKSFIHSQQMLLNLQKAFDENLRYRDNLRLLIEAVDLSEKNSVNMGKALFKLLQVEQMQVENSLADSIKKKIKNIYPLKEKAILYEPPESEKLKEKRLTEIEKIKEGILKNKEAVIELFDKKDTPLFSDKISASIKNEIKKRLNILSKKYHIKRLYSPIEDVPVYLLESKEDESKKSYLAFMAPKDALKAEKDEKGQVVRIKNLYMIEAVTIIAEYQKIHPYENNRIEFIALKHTGDLTLEDYSPKLLENYTQKGSIFNIAYYFSNKTISQIYIALNMNKGGAKIAKNLSITLENDKLQCDLLLENDNKNPYAEEEADKRTQLLYDRRKWPIEVWITECFDNEEYHEIKIKSIDGVEWENPKTGKKEKKPVAAKIYFGSIRGKEACFYMKDSRISGGATGDLEGKKFVAACYISYLKGWPLYIWNDGAGANIKEGMVSLNRAGEGFMMNTLLWEKADKKEFYRYMNSHPDKDMHNLFLEINKSLRIKIDDLEKNKKNYYTVAIGVGASAGLDVYGSSQAAIQIMVDDENSYRVLTGSNVIRSVTGEDLTNYEIGGAKVMHQKTGIVDMIAESKIHLLSQIKNIHEMFSSEEDHKKIMRYEEEARTITAVKEILSEAIIRENVDYRSYISFKEKYHGSESLASGFAKLGGKKVLIMGPRSNFGLISVPSIIKANEILRVAYGVSAHQILVLGQKWFGDFISYETRDFRIRFDFIQLLQQKKGIQINIITNFKGLYDVSINSCADIIIFVKNETLDETEYSYVQRVATFTTDSLSGAFDIAHKVINMLDEKVTAKETLAANQQKKKIQKTPKLPKNYNEPFDIVSSIIKPVVDEEDFIELYSEMNNPKKEAFLVTGIARIDGKVTGIIADQPDVLGGAPDAPSTDKFRIFTEFINKNKIPLLMLSNSPGFVPGAKQERLRIQAIGARSLDANILGRVPVVSVVLNQNYGGRQIQAFSKYLRPGIIYIALKKSLMAVMGSGAAFDLFHGLEYKKYIEQGDNEKARKLREDFIEKFNKKASASNDAYNTGILDWLLSDIESLRENIIKGFRLVEKKYPDFF